MKIKLHKCSSLYFCVFITGIIFFGCSKKSEYWISTPSFSPDSQYIVFSAGEGNKGSIYRIKSNGTDIKRLTATGNSKVDSNPVYSPDGSRIVFSSTHGRWRKSYDLYMMNFDGTNVTHLTTGPDNDLSAIFSRDGSHIYFLRAKYFKNYSPIAQPHFHGFDIYSINADRSDLKALTNLSHFEISSPSVSFDGKYILVQMYKTDMDSLWLVSLDNPKELKPIRPDLDVYMPSLAEKPWAKEPMDYDSFGNPQFSPDGNSILFTWAGHYQGYYGHEIYLMNMETRKARKVTDIRSFIESPCFSPDGKTIVFINVKEVASEQETTELWIVNTDGTNPHCIMSDPKSFIRQP